MLSTIGSIIGAVLLIASLIGLIDLPAQCQKWVDRMGLKGKLGPLGLASMGFIIIVASNFPFVKEIISDVFKQDTDQPMGYLQLAKIVPQSDNASITPSKQFSLNMFAINPGPGRIFKAAGYSRSFILEASDKSDKEVRSLFEKERIEVEKSYLAGTMPIQQAVGVDDGIWMSILTDNVTQQQAEGFISGKTRFYWLSWLVWENRRGKQDSVIDCRWLQPLKAGTHKDNEMVWHFC